MSRQFVQGNNLLQRHVNPHSVQSDDIDDNHFLRFPDVLHDGHGGPRFSIRFTKRMYSTAPGTAADWGVNMFEYDRIQFYPQFVRRGPYW